MKYLFKHPSLFIILLLTTCFFASVCQGDLVAHWSFDDSGDRLADSSGNGCDLTELGTITYENGVIGDAMHLEGAGRAYYDFGSDVNMEELTVLFRVYQPSGAPAWRDYAELGYHTDYGSRYCYVLERDNSDIIKGYNQGNFVGASTSVTGGVKLTNAWHSIAFRISKSENKCCFYIDGKQLDLYGWNCVSNLNIVTIGGAYGAGRMITADLDDVRIYDNALTASEINWLHANPGKELSERGQGALMAHWTFDDSSDRYADSSENLQSLAPDGTVSFTTGVSGDAMHLNQTGSAFTDFKDLATLDEFTVSLWANTASDADLWRDYFEIGMPSTVTNTSKHAVVLELSGSNRVSVYNNTLGSIANFEAFSDIRDTWRHFVLVGSKSSSRADIYIDGVSEGHTTSCSLTASFNCFTVGECYIRPNREIKADIDDVQIYNYAISTSEVNTLFRTPGRTLLDPPMGTVILVH